MDKITDVTFAPAFAVVGALVVVNFLLKVGVWLFDVDFFLLFWFSLYQQTKSFYIILIYIHINEKMDSIHYVYTSFVSY